MWPSAKLSTFVTRIDVAGAVSLALAQYTVVSQVIFSTRNRVTSRR